MLDDDPAAVNANRERLRAHLPAEPCWLQQVHGSRVVEADDASYHAQADACVARRAGQVCAVMIADCLPVLLCDRAGDDGGGCPRRVARPERGRAGEHGCGHGL